MSNKHRFQPKIEPKIDTPIVYYECTRCRYRIVKHGERAGPKYMQCYTCGYEMPWKRAEDHAEVGNIMGIGNPS